MDWLGMIVLILMTSVMKMFCASGPSIAAGGGTLTVEFVRQVSLVEFGRSFGAAVGHLDLEIADQVDQCQPLQAVLDHQESADDRNVFV